MSLYLSPSKETFLELQAISFLYQQKQYVSWKEGKEEHLINKMPYAPFY